MTAETMQKTDHITDPAVPFSFTEARVRGIPDPPAGIRLRFKDATMPGLILRVTAGARTFAYRVRSAEVTLGRWPAMTVEAARAKAKAVALDPQAAAAARRKTRATITLGDAWAHLEAHPFRARDGEALRPSTLAQYRMSWEHLKPLAGRKPEEIDFQTVLALRHRIEKAHGSSGARRALALLSVLLPHGLPKNPAAPRRTLLPKIVARKRFMATWELGAFLHGLEAEPPLWRVFWVCALVAPLRRGNLAAAKWAHLDLAEPGRESWHVPAAQAKGRVDLHLPVAAPLAALLREWRRQVAQSEWVFPATGSVKPGATHVVNPLHAWRRALALGSAWRMCEALAEAEGRPVADVWSAFKEGLEVERGASWASRAAPGGGVHPRTGKPLDRAVAALADRVRAAGLDPEGMRLRNLRSHDLRRTAGSWAVQGGASMAIVAAALGHADQRTTAEHYGHLNDAPVRDLMNANAARILGPASVVVDVKPAIRQSEDLP